MNIGDTRSDAPPAVRQRLSRTTRVSLVLGIAGLLVTAGLAIAVWVIEVNWRIAGVVGTVFWTVLSLPLVFGVGLLAGVVALFQRVPHARPATLGIVMNLVGLLGLFFIVQALLGMAMSAAVTGTQSALSDLMDLLRWIFPPQ